MFDYLEEFLYLEVSNILSVNTIVWSERLDFRLHSFVTSFSVQLLDTKLLNIEYSVIKYSSY